MMTISVRIIKKVRRKILITSMMTTGVSRAIINGSNNYW